ncbi:PREDICTED: uncharacterized protein LOC108969557 isoform X2 [Bactrocera latifrons]|uniref:uncharacterized protein LOC108969557 isoform X2 n=1 Tax=Bactrocera latifrons TaxID=174628 RepID=UPI0008DDDC04|nr:PREDICTED: uncharacterized protein LOC108969557 isoform X2 [Bactrocera latifrons]
MYIQRKMRNTSLLLIFSVCFVTFQQTEALRRIKRGSSVSQNKTKLSSDLLSDIHNTSTDVHFSGHSTTTLDNREGIKSHNEHTWAKKAVAAVEHAIDQAFASLSHKSDAEKTKRTAHNTSKPKDGSIASHDVHMTALSHLLAKRGIGSRIFEDMQREAEFASGEGPAEVLIIDNGFQPIMGMQHGINSYALHQPNLRNVGSNLKHLAEISKESKLNNQHGPKLTSYTSDIGADVLAIKHSNNNGISELNGNKGVDVAKNKKRSDNNDNDSRGEYKTVDNHRRNNDHVTLTIGEHNSINNNNDHIKSNNDELIAGKSHSTNTLQQHSQQLQPQKLQEQPLENRNSFPSLLSHSQKSVESIGAPNKLQEESEGLQQRKKHENDKSVAVGDTHNVQQATALATPHQQQGQFDKHSNGKMLPMESFLKFANMMLYKMGVDGIPMHAQGAQLAVSGNPTTSVISIGPIVDGAEEAGAMDYLYNPFEPQLNLLRNPGSFIAPTTLMGGSTNTALVSRPYLLPPYSLASSNQPINFIENALDLLLNAEEEGNDEMELFCPIHHPKKKSSDGNVDGKDKDGVIQVCSCRFFKKNKN